VSAKVSTLLNVGPAGSRYVFLLIVWNDFVDQVRDELTRQKEAFGLDLGEAGVFVEGYQQRMYDIADEVLAKPWPPEIRVRMENDQEPILLVFEQDWRIFDPTEHQYGIIWMSDFMQDSAGVRTLFQQLSRRSRQGEDVIGYLRGVAAVQGTLVSVEDVKRGIGFAARLASYFEIKPRIFGVSLDLKAILRDIAERRN
jgi:hypothetical protein